MTMSRANMKEQVNPKKSRTPQPPKSKAQAFAEFKKKNGYFHDADPKNPMNRERTPGMMYGGKVKKMKHGGPCRGMGAATKGGNFTVS